MINSQAGSEHAKSQISAGKTSRPDSKVSQTKLPYTMAGAKIKPGE